MMSGWKTWLAVIGGLITGASLIVNGKIQEGITMILGALALLGIGGKLDKLNK